MGRKQELARVERDARLDEQLSTEAGRAEYWDWLKRYCEEDSLIHLLDTCLDLEGDVIECGVYRGKSLQRLARHLAERASTKMLYGLDSFGGFPKDKVKRVDVGRFRFLWRLRQKFLIADDVPARMQAFFQLADINGEIVKGYFAETLPRFAKSTFCFIHLDCDIYESYIECLEALWNNLVPGGVMVFDDYGQPKWPGAKKAVDEFFTPLGITPELCTARKIEAWYIRKPAWRRTV